jgi:hypothetical protein
MVPILHEHAGVFQCQKKRVSPRGLLLLGWRAGGTDHQHCLPQQGGTCTVLRAGLILTTVFAFGKYKVIYASKIVVAY